MNPRCCGKGKRNRTIFPTNGVPTTLVQVCHGFAGWMLPGGGLILLPKCPACLAAYVAVVTGVGISLSIATYLRLVLLTVGIGWIAYWVGRHAWARWNQFPGTLPSKASRELEPLLDANMPGVCDVDR